MQENAALATKPTDVEVPELTLELIWDELTADQQYFVDYRASGGLRLDLSLTTDKTSVTSGGIISMLAFAAELKVDPSTLYRWEQRIPRFGDLKAMRRKMIYGNRIVDAVWRRSAVQAMKGNSTEIDRILNNFDPNYKSPKQVNEIELGENLLGIFDSMRREAAIIDGEFTETEPDSGTASVDGQERPADLPSQP